MQTCCLWNQVLDSGPSFFLLGRKQSSFSAGGLSLLHDWTTVLCRWESRGGPSLEAELRITGDIPCAHAYPSVRAAGRAVWSSLLTGTDRALGRGLPVQREQLLNCALLNYTSSELFIFLAGKPLGTQLSCSSALLGRKRNEIQDFYNPSKCVSH